MDTNTIRFLGIVACAAFALSISAYAGSVTGTVTYSGEIPKLPPIDLSSDPACAAMHGDNPPVNEVLVLGEGQTLGNILVRVTKGLPEKAYPAPSEPLVLTQEGCQYKPRVFVLHPRQTLRILNPDGILHNVHGMPAENTPFNRAMPATLKEIEITLPKAEAPFEIKCDLHRWMHSFCAVLDHPFYSITGKDGVYTIDGLEPGEYEITAWHEKLPAQTAMVTVTDNTPVKRDFALERPQR